MNHEVNFKYLLVIAIIGMAVFPCYKEIPASNTQFYYGIGMAFLGFLNLDFSKLAQSLGLRKDPIEPKRIMGGPPVPSDKV